MHIHADCFTWIQYVQVFAVILFWKQNNKLFLLWSNECGDEMSQGVYPSRRSSQGQLRILAGTGRGRRGAKPYVIRGRLLGLLRRRNIQQCNPEACLRLTLTTMEVMRMSGVPGERRAKVGGARIC
jgi:hypothetical protein